MDWEQWQRSWDAQQEAYLPDREQRFTAMLDAVESACGTSPRVLDLAGGTGSITRRLLARLPGASAVVLDVDAALLTIARGSFDGDARVRICAADLATPTWLDELDEPARSFDAVLTATALHWLDARRLAEVYAEVVRLLAPGGVVVNADHVPDAGLTSLGDALVAVTERRGAWLRAEGSVPDWSQWWDLVRSDPVLAGPAAERDARFANRLHEHTESTMPVDWHVEALRAGGCAEAGLVWRGLGDAAVCGRVASA